MSSSSTAVPPVKESNNANEKTQDSSESTGDNDMNSSKEQPKFRVAHCQEMGRYLVTAKNLAKGEIIFQEFPIASGPERDSVLICPGCYEAPDDEAKVSKAVQYYSNCSVSRFSPLC